MKCRIAGGAKNVRTMYQRKAVKVVPVDEGHEAGEKPAGEEG
jgi:hypothetical protein